MTSVDVSLLNYQTTKVSLELVVVSGKMDITGVANNNATSSDEQEAHKERKYGGHGRP